MLRQPESVASRKLPSSSLRERGGQARAGTLGRHLGDRLVQRLDGHVLIGQPHFQRVDAVQIQVLRLAGCDEDEVAAGDPGGGQQNMEEILFTRIVGGKDRRE